MNKKEKGGNKDEAKRKGQSDKQERRKSEKVNKEEWVGMEGR